MPSSQDTIAAIATPLGEGGLGVLRISGCDALGVVSAFFQPTKNMPLRDAESHRCYFGTVEGQTRLDQAVATVFLAPNSYTGEDVVELSVHGSPFILEQVLQLALRHGARLAGPGEFTQRAFVNGKMDLTQAEAVAELIRARTDKAHGAALAQLEGKLSNAVRQLRSQLLPLLAHVEVGLDHSDEDHNFLKRESLEQQCLAVDAVLQEILTSARIGKVLRYGVRVALVGRPNVGKSSLLNALLKEERAIVTPIPGTTRDTLEETVNWDGFPVVVTDTAGLRDDALDDVEKLGMARTQNAVEQADLVLGLFDGSQPITSEDESIVRRCAARPHLWVVNKSDLPASWSPNELSRLNGGAPVVSISAATGAGLPALMDAVKQATFLQLAHSGQAQWLLNARHRDALERAREAIARAVAAARSEAFEECVALELQSALSALGDIIGETSNDELLGQIFSQFCVGK